MLWKIFRRLIFIVFGLLMLGAGCARNVVVPVPTPVLQSSENITAVKTVIFSFDADMTVSMRKRLDIGQVKAWYDPAIIDVLQHDHLPARIFVTGLFAETYPDLVREFGSLANVVIGNHTYDHASFEPDCYRLRFLHTDKEKQDEITKTQTILKNMTGREPTLFRYPGLCRNAHDDALVAAFGLAIDDGTLASGDAFQHNPDVIVNTVLRQVRDGSEIIFHLGGTNAPATATALARIIPALQARGFTFEK